jgi:hypothetical protein
MGTSLSSLFAEAGASDFDEIVQKLDNSFRKLTEHLNTDSYQNAQSNPNIQNNQDKIQKIHKRILSVLDKAPKELDSHWCLSGIITEYCDSINGGRDAEIEKRIVKIYSLADEYSQDIIPEGDRWIEYEEELNNSHITDEERLNRMSNYVHNRNSRWESFEKLLLEKGESVYKDSEKLARVLVRYCQRFSFRWKEAEKLIVKSASCAVDYANQVIGGRWIEAEPSILKSIDSSFTYLSELKFAWPEYEKKIKKRSKRILEYAKHVIHGRLPDELHNRMIMYGMNNVPQDTYCSDKAHAEDYFEFLKNSEIDVVLFLKSIDEEERKRILSKV